MSQKNVYIESFGCQMNVLDGELLLGRLMQDGYAPVKDPEEADVLLYNTCSVRDKAEQKATSIVGALKHLKKRKPEVTVGIIGCMAQRKGNALLKQLPHVDLVAGPQQLRQVPDLLRQINDDRKPRVATEQPKDDFFLEPVHTPAMRKTPFQAFVKAIEGCNCSCTFCIVPTVRGAEISRPADDIVEEVKQLADEGVKEITLLGQTINAYGKGMSITLADLFERLNDIEGLARIRFVTSHPLFNTEPIFRAMNELPKVCEYLHLPAQSGSNRVLKAMRRGYTAERYREIADRFSEVVPHGALASDWIVGFPTESDEEFQMSVKLMEDTRPQNSFIFKYSPRPGTSADELPDDVPDEIKKARNWELLKIQEKLSLRFNEQFIDQEVEVLVEGPSKTDPNRWMGRTRTWRPCVFEHPKDLTGEVVNVKIHNATPLTLMGDAVLPDEDYTPLPQGGDGIAI